LKGEKKYKIPKKCFGNERFNSQNEQSANSCLCTELINKVFLLSCKYLIVSVTFLVGNLFNSLVVSALKNTEPKVVMVVILRQ
jgi:hypothetical protein